MFIVANRRTVIILIQCAPENYFETAHHNQGQKKLAPGLLYKSKEKIRTSFLFPLIKKPWGRGCSKNYSTKKCALSNGGEKLFLEEGAFFIKDNKVISVNISRRYVMHVMLYHYADNLWNSATFACFRTFRNCWLRESNPYHCGANSIELTTMICNFAILISCSNTIPNSRPLFKLAMRKNHESISFDKIYFYLI